MRYDNEQILKIVIICLTLIWHILIIYALFFLANHQEQEPLTISYQPQLVEYLLNQVAGQQQSAPPLMQSQPQAAIAQAHTAPSNFTLQQPQDDDGTEHYTLQKPISTGSLSQGSIVLGTQEPAGEKGKESDELPRATQDQEQNRIADTNQDGKTNEPDTATPVHTQEPEQTDNFQDEQTESVNRQDSSQYPHLSNMAEAVEAITQVTEESGSSFVSETTHNTNQQPSGTRSGQTQDKPRSLPTTHSTGQSLSLADITRGYIKHMHEEVNTTGKCTYNPSTKSCGSVRHGAYAGPADGVALAEQLYAAKLYNLLEQSAQAFSNQIYAMNSREMDTTIEVTIEKSGRILDVALKPEIPEQDLAQQIYLIVRKVGLFPPIPRQFHKQRIILSIPIHITSSQGFASYRLLYGSRA